MGGLVDRLVGVFGRGHVWIGNTRVLGFNRSAGPEPYRAALQRELHGPSPWRYAPWLGLVVALALMVWPALGARLKRSR